MIIIENFIRINIISTRILKQILLKNYALFFYTLQKNNNYLII